MTKTELNVDDDNFYLFTLRDAVQQLLRALLRCRIPTALQTEVSRYPVYLGLSAANRLSHPSLDSKSPPDRGQQLLLPALFLPQLLLPELSRPRCHPSAAYLAPAEKHRRQLRVARRVHVDETGH